MSQTRTIPSREAEASCRRALQLKPDFVKAHSNLAIALREQGRVADAEAGFKRALELDPAYAEAHVNYAFLLLQTGRFERGWQEYEYRWQAKNHEPLPAFGKPLWLGESDVRNKSILLWAEQGLGDSIQFVRYATLLAQRGATVHLLVPPPLKALLASCTGVASVLVPGEPLPPFDYHCPLLSLPLACKTELDTIPANIPYLAASAAAIAQWRDRLGEPQALRVGLVWAGSPRTNQPSAEAIDRQRSIGFNRLQALLDIEGIEFYSLQVGEPARSQLNGHPKVRDFTGQLHDFSDTAALIANLDLVISVDTSVIHVAGALGKPVWLLNRYNTCWRWLSDRSDSPWYPSLRIFRQLTLGDWDGVIDDVRQALLQRIRASDR